MRLLVVNIGSSSLKLHVLASGPGDDHQVLAELHVDGWDGRDTGPIEEILGHAPPVEAVGHRVVHGGTRRSAELLDDAAIEKLRELAPLASLHQDRAVAGITAARLAVPDVPHVACFDTAYHATMPEAAATYALPAEWRNRWPLRRYGFHGLSHAYAARRASELVPAAAGAGVRREVGRPSYVDEPGDRGQTGESPAAHGYRSARGLRVVSCHLGAGASLCASLDGRSVDTTMGFTPLEGLVMATRSGSVDPGLVLWLVTEAGLDPEEVHGGLERSSGLKGLAGTGDMREILSRRSQGDANAQLAFDVYTYAICRHVAAMAASLGGLDVLVFTGGVGENAPEVRAEVAARLGFLGVAVNADGNTAAVGSDDKDITDHDQASVASLVVPAREDLEIARQTATLLDGPMDTAPRPRGDPMPSCGSHGHMCPSRPPEAR